jgi:aspartate carbamoyltransferase regulatory subunit
VTIAINTESRKMGRKDLLFIENREFSASDIARIALVAHGGTWNTVRNRAVIIKQKIELPQQVEGILSCVNPNCVTNRDHLPGRFRIRASPLSAKCWYCERVIPGAELYRVIR